jgi:VanZ family protein
VKGSVTRWVPAAAWAAFLFLASTRESLPVDLDSGLDKIAHFAAYLILGFLLARGAAATRKGRLGAVAIGWAYGALDELHQSMVPGRIASTGDWLADAAGTIVGVLFYVLMVRMHLGSPERVPGGVSDATGT